MELKIKPSPNNTFPIGGFLIKGASAVLWLKALQELNLSLSTIALYPIPNTTANSVWGCFVIPPPGFKFTNLGMHELCQQVSDNVFIPERAILSPKLPVTELDKLFSYAKYLVHPEFGWVELTETLDWSLYIEHPDILTAEITTPQAPVFIPERIDSFQIKALTPEEVLQNMELSITPETLDNNPLSRAEKIKLALYQKLFAPNKPNPPTNTKSPSNNQGSGLWAGLGKMIAFIMGIFAGGVENVISRMQENLSELEKRNQNELDRLMEMFKTNPNDALKYAIPLDGNGSSRGNMQGEFQLAKRWSNFSLFGQSTNTSGGGGNINLGDGYNKLEQQYYATALALIKEGEYEKAAFIYLKLLKKYLLAAETLEKGHFYQEAATIYLKYCNDKAKAAACYEKGNMTSEAIRLYDELNNHEKVGDLYISIGKKAEANIHYERLVNQYTSNHQYLKASLVYKDKMNSPESGQALLLKGWRQKQDAFNCLNNYLNNIQDFKILEEELSNIHKEDVNDQNRELFLQILQHEYRKQNELGPMLREMAYEVVATQAQINPRIVKELTIFNKSDKELSKDTIRFLMNPKQAKS